MRPTPFNTRTDWETIPFDERHYEKAAQLKRSGLHWDPHVGCFVWDPDHHIQVSSPFPGRLYFILNLGHFLTRFETVDGMRQKLVWVPTWHQTRLLCQTHGIPYAAIREIWQADEPATPGEELLALYDVLLKTLK
jgi:hypothetical protein